MQRPLKRQSPPRDRPQQFVAVRRELASRFPTEKMVFLRSDLRRTFRRASQVFSGEGGGWSAWLWFAWRLNWPWLLVAFATLVVVLAALANAVR